MTTEEKVRLVADMLRSVGREAAFDPQTGFDRAVPCSFHGLNQWISAIPSEEHERLVADAVARLSFTHELTSIDGRQLEVLGDLAADDPRLHGFVREIISVWPSRDRLQQIVQIYSCAARTLKELIEARPNLPKGPLTSALEEAIAECGASPTELSHELDAVLPLFADLIDFVPSMPARELDIVEVSAPEINLMFSASGSIMVADEVATFSLPGSSGEGFLQSRRAQQPGEAGTAAQGLIGCSYRLSFKGVSGGEPVVAIALPVVDIQTLDFATAGVKARGEVYVITNGGIGSRQPSRAVLEDIMLRLIFEPPLAPGDGSFFIGVAAPGPIVPSTATLTTVSGLTLEIRVLVPSTP